MIEFPPWLQTTLTVLAAIAVALPPLGRLLALRWPDFGARLEALGTDIATGLGRVPPAGLPRGVAPSAPVSARAENATTVVRAEMKKVARDGGPPTVPPGVVMLAAVCLALVAGCTRAEQIQDANSVRTGGHATFRSLGELCDFTAAESLPTIDERKDRARVLVDAGCEIAWQAQRAFALAHRAQVRAIEAAERGECLTTTPRSAPACSPLAFAAATYEAGIALADAIAAVRAAGGAK